MASVYELAQLSNAAYKTDVGMAGPVTGWKAVQSFGDARSGFYAVHFSKQTTSEVALAVRGTDPSQMSDLGADAQLAVGSVPHQFYPAEQALQKIKGALGSRLFYLTGHSLGGGIASMLSARYRLPVVTFNAPGMKTSYTSLVGGVSPLSLASSSMAGSPYGGMPVYDPMLTQQIESLQKAEKALSALDTSKMLNIRASGDGVSIGTGPAIGRVESITIPEGSLNGWQVAAGIVVPVIGLVQGGNYLLKQHSMDNMVRALSILQKYHSDLRWVAQAVAPPAPPPPKPPGSSGLNIQRVHTVAQGETLSKIALRYYGDAQKWPVLYGLPTNKAIIGTNPSVIRPGMRLVIP